ncbi:ankyrin repeat protein [Moumouvirus australiensis]|uniref:Ankyrin repeat protein n=1 Tax=Moumouvirus australiensis TaxID=2109587 RepID=A0A2P1EMQ1_9VIRU|nr:ankyrin repeat protein [Moumouvirus australiensis]AVL95140.1 ankyrin repeat protein [Moumouvirus australiensis]
MGINHSSEKYESLSNLIYAKEDEYYVENIRNFCERYPERINECALPGAHGLFFACTKNTSRNMIDIVRMLIDYGADVNMTHELFPISPLLAACTNKDKKANPDIIKLLIERGANINMQDSNGNTILMRECLMSKTCNNQDIIKILLDNGADKDIKNKSGQTARDIIISFYNDNYLHTIESLLI